MSESGIELLGNDYTRACLEVAAAMAEYRGPGALRHLAEKLHEHLACDAVLILEQTDAVTALCRISVGGDQMLESISGPGVLADALEAFECRAWESYRASPHADPVLTGWGAASIAVLPASKQAETGAAVLLLWKTPRAFPEKFGRAVAPVWALLLTLFPHQKTQTELAEAKALLAGILDTIPEAIVFVDNDGERGWLNGPASAALGLPAGSVLPLRISAAMRDLRNRAVNAAEIEARAAVLRRDMRAEIRDWTWRYANPFRVLSVSTRMTNVEGVFGRIWVLLDVTALAAAEQDLKEKEERWQLALEGANEGIWDWNALTGEVFYSPRWKRMLGYRDDELPNDAGIWEAMVHPDDLPAVKEALQAHLDQKADHYRAEYRIRCRDGSWKWVLAQGKAIWDEQGHPLRLVGAHADISLQKQTEELLREARQAADKANSAKSDFLARMSHEIRTPMNAILGLSDLLQDTRLDEKQHEYVRVFRRNAERLLGLINDILDISKVEAGALRLRNIRFRLPDVVNAVRDLLAALALAKKLELRFESGPAVPTSFRGDPDRLQQILVNLVGNAIKFTNEGSVTVRVTGGATAPRPERGLCAEIRIEVADTGPSIRAEELSAVFEPFVQADTSSIRKHQGTGLGLAIAKKLVEMMEGTIWIESELHKGTSFFFTAVLELADEPEQEREAVPVAGVIAAARPARILVAEDSEDNRFLVRAYLEGLPYTLDFAEDGAIALRKALSQTYDLILMDVEMPEIDGYQVAAHIRSFEKSRNKKPVPIVVLTAHALTVHAEKAKTIGCDGWLSKPVNRHDLCREIARLLTPRGEERPKAPPPPESHGIPDPIRAMIPVFLNSAREMADRLGSLIGARDLEGIRIIGHNLKGTGTSFGFPEITSVGAAIEAAAMGSADGLPSLATRLNDLLAKAESQK